MIRFSQQSLSRLRGVHPKLCLVVHKALSYNVMDFKVDCGLRTKEDQEALYAKGRTTPGEAVTWTLESKHMPQIDGYGHAVDLLPYPVDYNDTKRFYLLAALMFRAAMEEEVQIRWGLEFAKPDLGHFEII